MELDDLALPLANRWSKEQAEEQIAKARYDLDKQVAYSFGVNDDASMGCCSGHGDNSKLGLPPRVKTFLNDVRSSGRADGAEIGQFIGFSVAVLEGLAPIVATHSAILESSQGNITSSFKDLVEESQALNRICNEKVAMAEGDDLTSEFVSRERLEAHRAQLMDFLRKQLPMGVRPPLNKLPAFMSRKLIPDSEPFQW